MKVLLGHIDWGLGTKGPHSDPADKTFLGLCIVSNVSTFLRFVKNGVKTSVAGSCTKSSETTLEHQKNIKGILKEMLNI